ncbi:MAG: PD-(D/E)XK nuclease family protein, partial [Phycisphaerae bacterium]
YLVSKHRADLREFDKVAERTGFIRRIAQDVAELLQEAVTVDQLGESAAAAVEDRHPSADRLHDIALIYRAYLDYLGDDRVDPEGVLDLARARLAGVSWLRGARVWVDGFAGLTRQQARMLAALGQVAAHIDIALLLDPTRGKGKDLDAPEDDLSLFARTEHTWTSLARTLIEAGLSIEPTIKLTDAVPPRFAGSPRLAELERRFFFCPAATEEERAAPAPCPDAPVRLVRAPDRRGEVDAAVRAMVDLVQRADHPLRYRDIAIVVRDLSQYHDLLSASLRRHDIPFFIDRRRPTYHHPLVQAVRGALGLIGGVPFGEAMTALLKSGLTGLTDTAVDAVENYALAYGLWTPEAWQSEWVLPVVPLRDGEEPTPAMRAALAEVEAARGSLRERLGEWWTKRRGRPKGRVWVERLHGLLRRLFVPEQLQRWSDEAEARGDLDEAAEHEHVWNDLIGLLDELVDALGDAPMTPRQFRAVVESGLADFTLGLVPATLDQVLVGSVERSRHPAVRAVFVLGFSDGAFPARSSDDSILGDAERAFLEAHRTPLGRTRRQQLFDERLLAYIAVTRPSECLWVSYPASDETGRPVKPSPYWAALRAALPEVPIEHVETEGPQTVGTSGELAAGLALALREWAHAEGGATAATPWLTLYEWCRTGGPNHLRSAVGRALSGLREARAAALTPAAAAAVWPPPYHTSVTRLETFAQCPFRHFAAYGLKLSERADREPAPVQLGSLYHRILEQFVNETIETGVRLADLSPAEIANRLNRLCDQVIPTYAEELNWSEGQRKMVRWRGGAELSASVEGQRATLGQTRLRPEWTERWFDDARDDALPAIELTTPSGATVRVRGKIDRLDLLQADDAFLAVVFDYKRSARQRLRLDEVYHGLALQLLAYLLVIRERFTEKDGIRIIPGGAFYLPLLADFHSVDHPDEVEEDPDRALDGFKPRGVVDFDWIDRLDPIQPGQRSAVFTVARKKDGGLSDPDKSDAVTGGALPRLLEHVRDKMIELAEAWIGGEIGVRPARLNGNLPCTYCPYQAVCRFEYITGRPRTLESMSQSAVLARLAEDAGEPDV